jgi:hypothetical protein
LESASAAIQAELEAIERDDALYEEAGFGSRLEALDAIEASILVRVEGLLATHGQAQELVTLQQRAEALKSRLEVSDEDLFRRLRAGIRAGDYRGAELRRQLETYAGTGRGKRSQAGGAYDSLDALVGGVLLAGAAPGAATEREPEMVFYQPTPARIVFELVEKARLQGHDTFYDLGSGLGQVVILVNLLTGVTAKGVEIDPAYCEYATHCAEGLGLPEVEFINADARAADYAGGTVFFLYTPFEGSMLQQVLDRLGQEAGLRRIAVYTYGPCTWQVSRQDWLESVDQDDHHVSKLAAFRSVRG